MSLVPAPEPPLESLRPPPMPDGYVWPDGRHVVERPDLVGRIVILGGVRRPVTYVEHVAIIRDGEILWEALKFRFDDKDFQGRSRAITRSAANRLTSNTDPLVTRRWELPS